MTLVHVWKLCKCTITNTNVYYDYYLLLFIIIIIIIIITTIIIIITIIIIWAATHIRSHIWFPNAHSFFLFVFSF